MTLAAPADEPRSCPDTNRSKCQHERVGDMCMRGERGCSGRMEGAGSAEKAIVRLTRGQQP